MSITQPPNPFIGYTSEQFAFVGTATDASGKDVTADCDWVWYFTKGKGVSGNPVLYAFAKAGEVTVTATAHLKGDSGAATITGTISDAPPAGKMVIAPFMYAKLADDTRVDPGGTLCDMCAVYMELPPAYAPGSFQKKASNSSTWTNMPSGSAGQLQHDGVTWSVYRSTGWSTWGEKNWGVDWRAAYSRMGMPPQPGFATGTWTVFNTIVTSGDGVILFDPDDEALDEATIPWSITHMDYHPTFDVTVSVTTVTGSLVKTLTATAGLGADSITWDGSTNAGPTATKGVYTYQVSAVHRWCEAHQMYCQYAAFADLGVQGGLPGFELHADLDQARLKTGYTLSRAVAACGLDVFDPALSVCHSASSLATVAGTYESDWIWKRAVSGPPHTYTNVVSTVQTATEGQQNRNQQPKPGLRRGGGQTYGVLAVCYRDPAVLSGWGDVPDHMAMAGYTALCADSPCGSNTAAQAALNIAAVWVSAGHGAHSDDPACAQVCLTGLPAEGYLFDYRDPSAGAPPGYDPQADLNVDEYAGEWEQLRFALLLHCRSGIHSETSDLLGGLVDAGAKSAVGFEKPILIPFISTFLDAFWDAVRWGASVSGACSSAQSAVGLKCLTEWGQPLEWSGFDSLRITEGGGVVPLKPARYGWGQP